MPVQAADILDVRLWRAPDHTRVVFDLSDTISYSLLELDNPQRLVIDVADARLINALTNLPLENTPISRVRSGVRYGDNLRIVFDLKAKIRPKSFPLDPTPNGGQSAHWALMENFWGESSLLCQKQCVSYRHSAHPIAPEISAYFQGEG